MTPTTPTPPTRDFISPRHAARLTGVTVRTLARWTDKGYLTDIRTPGGQRRYDHAEICAWIDATTEASIRPPRTTPTPPDVAAIIDQEGPS